MEARAKRSSPNVNIDCRQHYKCKEEREKTAKKKSTPRLTSKGVQIKTGNKWLHFPAANIAPSQFDGKRFPTSFHTKLSTFGSHIVACLAIPHRPKLTQKCVQVSVVCNVISHKTLNWFLFTIFFSVVFLLHSLAILPPLFLLFDWVLSCAAQRCFFLCSRSL